MTPQRELLKQRGWCEVQEGSHWSVPVDAKGFVRHLDLADLFVLVDDDHMWVTHQTVVRDESRYPTSDEVEDARQRFGEHLTGKPKRLPKYPGSTLWSINCVEVR